MNDKLGIVLLSVAIVVVGVLQYAKDPVSVQVMNEEGTTQVVERNVGAVSGPDYYEEFRFHDGVSLKEPVVSPMANYTLLSSQSGTVVNQASTTGLTITLPPVAAAGSVFKFVVGAAFATNNFIVDSAEGDNIEGTVMVVGAVVDCDGEDQLNFVASAENVGDFVELRSNGSKWIIGASGALTTGGLTCTDPS